MDVTNIENEFYDFINNLYIRLKEELSECSSISEINEIFDEEFNNLNDYKKMIRLNAISKIEEELSNKNYGVDTMEKALETENEKCEIEIPHIQIDENKVYASEESKPIIEERENDEKKSTKIIVAAISTIVGAALGWILKRDILDAIIIGFIGTMGGVAIYEAYFSGDNKKLEKVIERKREFDKRIDMEYLNSLLSERKFQMENLFTNYINKFSNS
jgi:hypothetical protein